MTENRKDCTECRFVHVETGTTLDHFAIVAVPVHWLECRFGPPPNRIEPPFSKHPGWNESTFPVVRKWMWCHQFQPKQTEGEAQ